MKTKQAIELAGSATELARLLDITVSAVSQWSEDVPKARVWHLQVLKPEWFRAARRPAKKARPA